MAMTMKEKIKAYIDLTRAHFAPVWPLLFCSGLMLAFKNYDYFSWGLLILAVFIGLFGFEAGLVLNDIIDHNIDKLDTNDDRLTKYWRPFKARPIPSGRISLREAIGVFVVLVLVSIVLIAFVPFPNYIYIYIIMAYTYSMEIFYQLKKRNQRFPIAQILGRTDLLLFPIAGYLCYGQLDITVFLYIIFVYPWALAHLGINDLIDVKNDQAKNLKTVTILYGLNGNIKWIVIFSLIHLFIAPFFVIFEMGVIAFIGFTFAWGAIVIANILIIKGKDSKSGLRALFLFHGSLLIYILSIIIDSSIIIFQ